MTMRFTTQASNLNLKLNKRKLHGRFNFGSNVVLTVF